MNEPLFSSIRLILLGIALVALCDSTIAQSPEWARVMATHESLRAATNQDDRLALHEELGKLWPEALATGHAFGVDWSLWNNAVVDLGTENERLLTFTWNVELDDRTQRYGGWVAYADVESDLGYTFVMLEHNLDSRMEDVGRLFRHDQWPGGLYYDGVITYDRNAPIYTLLAWDGADALTTRKKIETIEHRNGRVRFGAPIFDLPTGLQKRVILTYGDAVQATLRNEPDMERIVFDHLAPEDASLRGQYAFYGPTLSYDGLVWRKGRWQFMSDVPVRNSKEGSSKEYRDPRNRGRRN